MDNIWEIALGYIQQQVVPLTYESLFSKESVLETARQGSLFYISVCDENHLDALKKYHLDKIKESLFIASGENLKPVLLDATQQSIPSDGQPVEQSSILGYGAVFNPRYVFDSFVVGASNRFTHAAAMAVAESPSRTYNPLFIYGGSGLGKTHLMHAIGQEVKRRDPFKRVTYVSSETFTNEFIHLLRKNQLERFKDRYRNADILLIDDIQFLIGKEQTQEEFFHTFNTLHEAGKQIVISSDRHPRELSPLEERLRSRFSWGLITDIKPPDWETRCAILQQKVQEENKMIADDVVYYIADKVKANIRELEGALNRVMYFSTLTKRDRIDMHLAEEALREIVINDEAPKITISLIQKIVCNYYQVSIEDLKGKKKSRNISFPRQVAMYLCRDTLGATLPQIGRDFGGRDHSTVIHACDKISAERMHDQNVENQVSELETLIKRR